MFQNNKNEQKQSGGSGTLIACTTCGKLCFGHCPNCSSTKLPVNKPPFQPGAGTSHPNSPRAKQTLFDANFHQNLATNSTSMLFSKQGNEFRWHPRPVRKQTPVLKKQVGPDYTKQFLAENDFVFDRSRRPSNLDLLEDCSRNQRRSPGSQFKFTNTFAPELNSPNLRKQAAYDPYRMGHPQGMQQIRRSPTSQQNRPRRPFVPTIDLNLSLSAENMRNLLNIVPVYYQIDTKGQLIGNHLIEKNRRKK